MTISEAPPSKPSPAPPLPRAKKGLNRMETAKVIRAWIQHRTDELNYEQAHQSINPISAGSSIMRGERAKTVAILLGELELFATWLDNGQAEFVPPMSEEAKREWRFARDHGADVPPHILAQL